MKRIAIFLAAASLFVGCSGNSAIDRPALVARNNPHLYQIDTMASLTVGNGCFAFTADVTGLQTFPELYSKGVPLGTMSDWGWHSFPNTENYRREEYLKSFDFGHGHEEVYACQLKDPRGKGASDYFRVNPHRLHLGIIGFEGLEASGIERIDQTLDMYDGVLRSSFEYEGSAVKVLSSCDPDKDMVAFSIGNPARTPVVLRFPYPTGAHADDAMDWTRDELHQVAVLSDADGVAVLSHSLDQTTYYVKLSYQGAVLSQIGRNALRLVPEGDAWSFCAEFCAESPETEFDDAEASRQASKTYWNKFWNEGGVVDFSDCTDPRAAELERRVVLSQPLRAAWRGAFRRWPWPGTPGPVRLPSAGPAAGIPSSPRFPGGSSPGAGARSPGSSPPEIPWPAGRESPPGDGPGTAPLPRQAGRVAPAASPGTVESAPAGRSPR